MQKKMMKRRRTRGRAARGLLLSMAVVGTGLMMGCPPRPESPEPMAALRPAQMEAAPVVGSVPATNGIYVPIGGSLPLSGEALAKARKSRGEIEAELMRGEGAATRAASAPATRPTEVPTLALKYYVVGRAKLDEGSVAEAVRYLDKALGVDPQAFPVLVLMGEAMFQSGQLGKGLVYLQRAAGQRPEDVGVNYLLGRYWASRGDWAAAARHFLRAERSPDWRTDVAVGPLVAVNLAQALQRAGYLGAAGREYERYFTLVGQPIGTFRHDRDLNFFMEEEWAVRLAAGENFYAAGQYAEALQQYRAAAEEMPEDRYIQGRLAAAEAYLGQDHAAVRRAVDLVVMTQGSDESLALLTWVYRAGGRQDRMLADLRGQVAVNPGDAGAVLALAALEQRSGRADAAMETLAAYLRAVPGDMTVLKRAVAVAQERGDVRTGFGVLVRALAAEPEQHAEVWREMVRLIGERPTRETLGTLEAVEARGGDKEGAKVEGYRQYLLGQVAQAADEEKAAGGHYERAVAALPEYFPAREAYLGLLLQEENYPRVRELVEQALALHSGGLKARQLEVEVAIAQERYANALALARKAKDDFPDSPEVRMLLVQVLRRREQDKEAEAELSMLLERFPRFEPGYRAAVELAAEKGERQRVEDLLGKMLTEVPESRYAQLRLARYLFEARREADAETILQRMMNEHPNEAEPVVLLATIRAVGRRPEEGVTVLKEALAKGPKERPALPLVEALADIYQFSKKPEEALAVTGKYYREHPNGESWMLLYAATLVQTERFNEAEEVLKQGLAKAPRSAGLTRTYASFMAAHNRAGEGAEMWEKFIGANGVTADRLYLLSHLYQEAGASDKCLAALERVLAIMPDHTGANNDLAYFWTDKGVRLEQAERMINKALENQPNNAAFLDSLGWVYYKEGKIEQAVPMLQKALSHISRRDGRMDPEVVAHLGDAMYRAGKKVEAAEYWRTAEGSLRARGEDGRLSPDEAQLRKYLAGVLGQVAEGKEPSVSPLAREAASQPAAKGPEGRKPGP